MISKVSKETMSSFPMTVCHYMPKGLGCNYRGLPVKVWKVNCHKLADAKEFHSFYCLHLQRATKQEMHFAKWEAKRWFVCETRKSGKVSTLRDSIKPKISFKIWVLSWMQEDNTIIFT